MLGVCVSTVYQFCQEGMDPLSTCHPSGPRAMRQARKPVTYTIGIGQSDASDYSTKFVLSSLLVQ